MIEQSRGVSASSTPRKSRLTLGQQRVYVSYVMCDAVDGPRRLQFATSIWRRLRSVLRRDVRAKGDLS